jgi:hypothetical protein
LIDKPSGVETDEVMSELHRRVRERLREQLADAGDPTALDDPEIFADVEALLRAAVATPDARPLVLPQLLGEPHTWRLTTKMQYQSHRGKGAASLIIFLKRRLLMPLFRWLYEYSRDNFERRRSSRSWFSATAPALRAAPKGTAATSRSVCAIVMTSPS